MIGETRLRPLAPQGRDTRSEPLRADGVFHVFNRGNNRENIFREKRNYNYFLKRYLHHVAPVVDTFAYCLLRNHFHLVVRIRPSSEWPPGPDPTQRFSNWFNGYTKAINRGYARTGSLFQKRFGRKEVLDDRYFAHLIRYIHLNPQIHGFTADFRDYQYSSYAMLVGNESTWLARDEVFRIFGDRDGFVATHKSDFDIDLLDPLDI